MGNFCPMLRPEVFTFRTLMGVAGAFSFQPVVSDLTT